MNIRHLRTKLWRGALNSALFGVLAFFMGGLSVTGEYSASVVHASAEWVGDKSGSLIGLDSDGKATQSFPLKHTDVSIQVSGPLARAQVTQQFENPYSDKIEAVYTFPLPQKAAVDDMTLTVGDRVVKGKIKKREEARAIYEAAKRRGNVAGLLDQERPNIFTQSVANILPGEQITIRISYVETLSYDDGKYSVVFPMVVGPRYIPGRPFDHQRPLGGGWAWDTDQVPDASHITPPVLTPGTRSGHDLSLTVNIDAGVPIHDVRSTTHEIVVHDSKNSETEIRLEQNTTIPNKDFILTYQVAGKDIRDAVLTHRNEKGGFFTLMLQPPDRVNTDDVTPKELVFVLDTSGSMSGFPIDKAKETMRLAIDGLNPHDTFNLIAFAGDTHILFPEPVPATPANVRKAQSFLSSRRGGGGTEMMKAIRAALTPSDSQEHVRIVCFMTDGYIGNDMAILGEVIQHPNARVFSFGIGSSVNRFLLDKMAEHGRGEVEYVGLKDDGSAAARRFYERVRHPLLTDISIDWDDVDVSEVYPKQLPDLFSAKPLFLTGRYSTPGKATIRLRGKVAGRAVVRKIDVKFPGFEPNHDVLATLWARTKIADLMAHDYNGIQQGTPQLGTRKSITQLGLDYGLMTQFTSFVAVEELIITEGGEPRRIEVPVELPEGVSYEGVFGKDEQRPVGVRSRAMKPAVPMNQRLLKGVVAKEFLASAPVMADQLEEEDVLRRDKKSIAKLDSRLRAMIEKKERGKSFSKEESARFRDGKIMIQVWLTKKTAETVAQIKRLGFNLVKESTASHLLIGTISIEHLKALEKLSNIRYVTIQPIPA